MKIKNSLYLINQNIEKFSNDSFISIFCVEKNEMPLKTTQRQIKLKNKSKHVVFIMRKMSSKRAHTHIRIPF